MFPNSYGKWLSTNKRMRSIFLLLFNMVLPVIILVMPMMKRFNESSGPTNRPYQFFSVTRTRCFVWPEDHSNFSVKYIYIYIFCVHLFWLEYKCMKFSICRCYLVNDKVRLSYGNVSYTIYNNDYCGIWIQLMLGTAF